MATLDQAYTLRQTYLETLEYNSDFPLINKKTNHKAIGKHIDTALKAANKSIDLPTTVAQLHKGLNSIVYLNHLAYFYLHNTSILLGELRNSEDNKARLEKLIVSIDKKQTSFHSALKKAVEGSLNQNKELENLINNEILYYEALSTSAPSGKLKLAASVNEEIDFNKIRTQAINDKTKLQALLKEYKLRCSQKREMTNMSGFIEKEEDKSTDSGNCSDDDASSYHTASGDLDEQTIDTKIQSQSTVCLEEPNEPTIPVKQQDKPTVHTEAQKQNPPPKESLLAQIWGLLKQIWQKIKNIFIHSEKNHGLDNTIASYSASEQRVTLSFGNIKEIPAKTKGYRTLYSTEADSRQNQSPEPERVVGFKPR